MSKAADASKGGGVFYPGKVDANTFAATGVSFFNGIQGATPKYAKNEGKLQTDFAETMARIYIDSPRKDTRIKTAEAISPQVALAAEQLYGNGYVDFILQSVQQGLSEKVEIVDNLSDGYTAYYFGQAPTVLQCSGAFLNSLQDDQVISMVQLYAEFIRGTKLAQHGETLRFRYDGFMYTGTVNNLQWSLQSENELVCPFSFAFLVKTRKVLP